MNPRSSAPFLLAMTLALLAGCLSSSGTDAGVDAGPGSGGSSGGSSGGTTGGATCAGPNQGCDPVALPCCSAADECDSIQLVCLPSSTGGTTGGTSGGGLPSDGAQWQEQSVSAPSLVGINGLGASTSDLAVGSGPQNGQLLQRLVDGGWSILPGVPPALTLNGVWTDPAGDVFAVGQQDGGPDGGLHPLLLAGSLDAGIAVVPLIFGLPDGGPIFTTLSAVVGIGPAEAVAVGAAPFVQQANALHLLPDGGVVLEALPPEISNAFRLVGGVDGGPLYALATSNAQLATVLERVGGIWTQQPVFGAHAATDISIGPSGDVTVVGDDGNGNGLIFLAADGGYFPLQIDGGLFSVPQLPPLPPLTAVSEPQPGELFLAGAGASIPLEIIHVDGGLLGGAWWQEGIPVDAQSIGEIAGDGASNFFAGGIRTCGGGCAGYPMILQRVP